MTDFMEPTSGLYVEDAFRHFLTREAQRATRYQDFFSICLVRADRPEGPVGEVHQALIKKISQFLRSTDMVGQVHDGIAILLLHTEGADAVRVAERIRGQIEQVAFSKLAGESPRQVTLSVGGVSFPRDGYNDTVLLSRAQAHLNEAARRGGNQVVYASEPRP